TCALPILDDELVAPGVGHDKAGVPTLDLGGTQFDQPLHVLFAGGDQIEPLALRPVRAHVGADSQESLVPPSGDWMAACRSRSHTSGQPNTSLQNLPASGGPCSVASARNPAPSRNWFPGSMTQNSLRPGSAITTYPSSGTCLMIRPPSSSTRLTVRIWSSRSVL